LNDINRLSRISANDNNENEGFVELLLRQELDVGVGNDKKVSNEEN
jgi:hypothetical protein